MEVQSLFENRLNLSTTEPERKLIRRLAELIGTRAARLSACGVAGICKKKGYTSCHVGADGSVFNKYPHFQERQAQALREIFGWGADVKTDPIQVVPAEDGSGVGAALIAALTLNVCRISLYITYTILCPLSLTSSLLNICSVSNKEFTPASTSNARIRSSQWLTVSTPWPVSQTRFIFLPSRNDLMPSNLWC